MHTLTCVIDATTLVTHIQEIKQWIYHGHLHLLVPLCTLERIKSLSQKSVEQIAKQHEAPQKTTGKPTRKEHPPFDINPPVVREFLTRHEAVKIQLPDEIFSRWKEDKPAASADAAENRPASFAQALLTKLNFAPESEDDLGSKSKGPVKPKLVARGSPSSAWKKTKVIPKIATSDVPKGLKPLFDYILWQLFENESSQASTNPVVLLSEDLEICMVAKKLKIPMKGLAEIRQEMTKRKDIELDRNVLGDLEVDFGIRDVVENTAVNGNGELHGEDPSYDEDYIDDEQDPMPEEKGDIKTQTRIEVTKAPEENVKDIKEDDSPAVLSNERQWTAYKANEFAAKNGLEPNESLPKVTPAAQLQSNLSAWNNFRITAAKQDKEVSRKATEEHAARLAEEARTGVKQEFQVPVFNETWRRVKVDDGLAKREVVDVVIAPRASLDQAKGNSKSMVTEDTDVKRAESAKGNVTEAPSKSKPAETDGHIEKGEKSDKAAKDSPDLHTHDIRAAGTINRTVRLAQRPSREVSPTPKKPSPLREELSPQTTSRSEFNGMVIHARAPSGQVSPTPKKSSPLREEFPAEVTTERIVVSSEVVVSSEIEDIVAPSGNPASTANAVTSQAPKQLSTPEIDSDEEVVVFDPKAKRLSAQRRSQRQSSRPMTPVEKPQALEKPQVVVIPEGVSQDPIVNATPPMKHVHTPHTARILSNPQAVNYVQVANHDEHRQVSPPIRSQAGHPGQMNQPHHAHPVQGAQQAQYTSYGRNAGRRHHPNTPNVANGARYPHHVNHQQGRPISSHSPAVIDPDSFGRSTFVSSHTNNANGYHRHPSPRAGPRSAGLTPEPDVDFVLKTGSPRSATRGKGKLWVPS